MKSCLLFTILCLQLFFASISFSDSTVVARVNKLPITAFELNEEFQDLLPLAGSFHGGVSEERINAIREKALANLIERELLYQHGVKKGIVVSDKEVNTEYREIESRFDSASAMKKALKESGLSIKEFQELIRKRLLTARVREIEIVAPSALTDKEVSDYYEKNKTSYKKPEEFRASHILIGVDPSSTMEQKKQKKAQAEDILKKIKAGEDFANLARKYSTDEGTAPIGGDMGSFHLGMAEQAIEKAILALKVGEISDVLESLYGYHIIKLTGKKPETQLSFEETKKEIKNKLEKKRADELYKTLVDDLRSKAKIEMVQK